jgi:hypothetical protein
MTTSKLAQKCKLLLSATALLFAHTVSAQHIPGATQSKSVLLLNGKAHIGNGAVISPAAVGFKNGKLTLVQNAQTTHVDRSQFDTVIDIKGKEIYPAFILPNTPLGLVEVDAVRATVDQAETGDFNPNARSIIAYNADSRITQTVRTNGVLVGQITPQGGYITGTSSVVHFDAWNWEDAVYKKDDGIHLNWPSVFNFGGWWAEPGATTKSDKYMENKTLVESFFKQAKAYHEMGAQAEKDLRMEAMKGVFTGSKTLFINANYAVEITDVVRFKKEFGIPKVVIIGGYDSWLVAELLVDHKIPVVLRRLHSLPVREDDPVDLPYRLPLLLKQAGVLFCLGYDGDMEAMGSRNLPFLAGTAMAYGLAEEDAIASISANTAKILGIDTMLGTLEVGKDATLFVSEGNALDMRTNKLILAYIQGRKIDLVNDQERLYNKYNQKYFGQ